LSDSLVFQEADVIGILPKLLTLYIVFCPHEI
jgi:hypothetical protein